MAAQLDGKSSGTTNARTPQYIDIEIDKDRDPTMNDVEATSRDIKAEVPMSRFGNHRQSDPITDLRERLSTWGKSQIHEQRHAYISDPNFPDDKRESTILYEASSVDDTVEKEMEDSPYPEVRAAVHNYGK